MTMNRAEAEEALALIRRVVNHVHDETILHNRGRILIMVAALDLLAFCVTQYLVSAGIYRLLPYATTWGVYLVLALAANLSVGTHSVGSMTYVERHVWGNGLTFYAASFAIVALDCWFFPPRQALTVIPAHSAVIGAVSFSLMTLLDTRYFFSTAVFFLAAAGLGLWPDYGFAVLGVLWFVCLSVPGAQYLRERRRRVASGKHTEVL